MKLDERAVKGLAYRGLDLWLNLELTRFKPDGEYNRVVSVLKQRFKAEELNPLLLVLGLLEMALIEDALKNKPYLTEEEREAVIREVVDSLSKLYPSVVDEMERLIGSLEERLKEFKSTASKFRSSGGE